MRATYEDGTVETLRQDVLINFHATHDDAEHLGITPEESLKLSLANESAGLLGQQYKSEGFPDKPNEAYTTIAGFASAFDKPTANLFVGTGHQDFIDSLVSEMEILADLGKKQF
jgi:hypothetical protein